MPSASQFIQMSRLQKVINGNLSNTKSLTKRSPYSYNGYAGGLISTLPPNVLTSNKFLTSEPEPEAPPSEPTKYVIDLDTGLGSATQSFSGSYSIPDTSFELNIGGQSNPGFLMSGMQIKFTETLDSGLTVTPSQGTVTQVGSDGKGFTIVNIAFSPNITMIDSIIFEGFQESVTVREITAQYDFVDVSNDYVVNTLGQDGFYTTSSVIEYTAPSSQTYILNFTGISGVLHQVLFSSTPSTFISDTSDTFPDGGSIALTAGDVLYLMPDSNAVGTLSLTITI